MRARGKAGVVTGASRGLGLAVVRSLLAEGAQVVATSRTGTTGLRSGPEPSATAETLLELRGDVRRESDVINAIEACRKTFGRIDFIVNNAGILGEGRLHETTNEQWNDLVAVHLTGAFWGCKHAIAAMREQGGGVIVNVGSILSFTGDGYLAAYTAMKSGVLGLTKAIAIDYARDGIRCNCVCPGDMETPMIAQYFEGTADAAAARLEMTSAYPGKRIADAAEVANAVLFLISDESSFVNGTSIVVDGGLIAKTY
jgi:NAD(P)-dependent dehydrogenase (short-subunit alcohol dehydrogenase family)